MGDNNKALLSGMGPLCKVGEAWMGEIGDIEPVGHDLREAVILLNSLLETHESERAAFALACSVLNRHFRKRRWLHRISDDCHYENEYVSADFVRDTMADNLNL